MKIIQFAFKNGQPVGPPVIDCRIIPNPYSLARADADRLALVRADPQFERLVQAGVGALERGHPEIAVGCQFGRHRSRAVAQEIAARTGAEIVLT